MPRTKDTVQLAIDVTEDARDRFKSLAKSHGKTCREFIDWILKNISPPKPRKSSRKTAISGNPKIP